MRIFLIAVIIGKQFTIDKYRVIDIDSGEIREVDGDNLIDAINNNSWVFKNIAVRKGTNILPEHLRKKWEALVIKEGINDIPKIREGKLESRTKYIMTYIDLVKNIAKLVRYDGKIIDLDLDTLYDHWASIAGINSRYNNAYRKLLEAPPTEDEIRLLNETDKMYESFIITTRTLGIDCAFEYDVSGNAVILQSYTGSSTHAIVPKFIDIIDIRAFYARNITELSLNDGLKVIGIDAFSTNNIREVDIPKTVTRICKQAFKGNNKLFKRIIKGSEYVYTLNEETFRVYNKDTVVSRQIEP